MVTVLNNLIIGTFIVIDPENDELVNPKDFQENNGIDAVAGINLLLLFLRDNIAIPNFVRTFYPSSFILYPLSLQTDKLICPNLTLYDYSKVVANITTGNL